MKTKALCGDGVYRWATRVRPGVYVVELKDGSVSSEGVLHDSKRNESITGARFMTNSEFQAVSK